MHRSPMPPLSHRRSGSTPTRSPTVRRFVEDRAAHAGLDALRSDDLVLAVNEIVTNSVRYGGGEGVLRMWETPDTSISEVRDQRPHRWTDDRASPADPERVRWVRRMDRQSGVRPCAGSELPYRFYRPAPHAPSLTSDLMRRLSVRLRRHPCPAAGRCPRPSDRRSLRAIFFLLLLFLPGLLDLDPCRLPGRPVPRHQGPRDIAAT